MILISGRLTAMVSAGASSSGEEFAATGDVGIKRGSAGAGGEVSVVAGRLSDAAGAGSADAGGSDSGCATGADVESGFAVAGGGDGGTGPGSGDDVGAVAGARAGGASLGGRKRSGSRYPFGSLVARTPRWTYGTGHSASPDAPSVPTGSLSCTAVFLFTASEPRWTSVTE
jgi:hypothetical protein